MGGSDIYVNQDNYTDGDQKPSAAYIGQKLKATNGKVWEWSGDDWGLIVDADANGNPAAVMVAEITKVYRGNYPETLYEQATAQTEGAVANDQSSGINMIGYDAIVFEKPANGATVNASLDGLAPLATVDMPFIDMGSATRAMVTDTDSGTGPYLLECPFDSVWFANLGAAQATITYARVGKTPAIAR